MYCKKCNAQLHRENGVWVDLMNEAPCHGGGMHQPCLPDSVGDTTQIALALHREMMLHSNDQQKAFFFAARTVNTSLQEVLGNKHNPITFAYAFLHGKLPE